MVSPIRALLAAAAVLASAPGCQPSWFTHFDTTGAAKLQPGFTPEQVIAAVGEPHHMKKTALPKVPESWSYVEMSTGLREPNVEVLSLYFDPAGRLLGISHVKDESTWGGNKTTKIREVNLADTAPADSASPH